MEIAGDGTEEIGRTPLVRLDAFAPNLVGKVEAFNPFSVTDRSAVGISGRAALAAVVRVARRDEHEDDLVGVVLPDSAERYLSTTLFEDESVPARRPEDELATPTPGAE